MKKLFLFLTMILVAAFAFASGEGELATVDGNPTGTITIMTSGNLAWPQGMEQFEEEVGIIQKIAAEFCADKPGLDWEVVIRDVSKGSMTFDTMLAAGNPPDIWIDAVGYFAPYLNDDYSIRLNDYIDLSRFQPALLDLTTDAETGAVYVVPLSNIATGMAINTSMLDAIGYTLPPVEDWTTDEFLRLAEKLKAVGIPATMVMGKGGLKGWTNIWMYAFGARMFAPGDWSKVTINSPEAREGLEYIKTLVERGYTPPPLESNDDLGVELFTTGKVFSCMMQNGHTDYWIPEQVRQGQLEEAFEYTFIEFPHAPGLDHTPVSGYQTSMQAKTTGDPAMDRVLAELVGMLSGMEAQWYYGVMSGGFPVYTDFAANIGWASYPSYQAIAKLPAQAGTYQEWPHDKSIRTELSRLWASLTEEVLRGKRSIDSCLNQFEEEANAIIAAAE